MSALVAARAREKVGGEDRRDEPAEYRKLDRARCAADDQIERKQSQRDDAAEQPWRDERSMTRGRQRVAGRRRVYQRLDIISDRREDTHVTLRTSDIADALPFF